MITKNEYKFYFKLFGKYDSGFEYWIYTNQIRVNPEWRKKRIGEKKFKRKMRYWYRTGKFESEIILDKNFNFGWIQFSTYCRNQRN